LGTLDEYRQAKLDRTAATPLIDIDDSARPIWRYQQ
jgi:hypothetical protein